MARIALHSGVHACIDKDAAVLLDLGRDRYFSMALPVGGAAEGASDHDRLAPISDQLIRANLAASVEAPLGLADIVQIQSQASLLQRKHLAPFFLACFWARKAVARRRIDLALAQLACLGAMRPAAPADEAEAWRVNERFERLRPFFPGARVCLFDTLALARFAIAQGVRLAIVFGVRVRPFSAHCWAEWRSIVLNDRYGHAHAYQPILRVAP